MVSSQKYLGVIFDSTLQWSEHVSAVCKKIYLFWINVFYQQIDSLVLDLSHLIYAHWGKNVNCSTSAEVAMDA